MPNVFSQETNILNNSTIIKTDCAKQPVFLKYDNWQKQFIKNESLKLTTIHFKGKAFCSTDRLTIKKKGLPHSNYNEGKCKRGPYRTSFFTFSWDS